MPKIFKTMFWSAMACLVATVIVTLFLPKNLDLVLWFGLMFVLGTYAGAATQVLSLNEFQLRAEREGAPCIHTVRSLRWWLAAQIGPKSDCGYSADCAASPSRPTSSSASSSRTSGERTKINFKPV